MSALDNVIPKGYKWTDIGVIPDDWEVASIDDISSLIGDGIHSTPIYDSNGPYYFVNGNNINNGRLRFTESTNKVSEAEYKKHKKKINKQTLFLSINGTIGNLCFYNNEPIILGKSAAYININNKAEVQYMYQALSFDATQQRFEDGLTGSTIKNLGLGTIKNTLLALPSIQEQTAIASALSDVDLLLCELEKLISKKQAIKTATMQQLLTGKTRLPQFAYFQADDGAEGELKNKIATQTVSQSVTQTTGTTTNQGKKKGTKPSELGEIPEDWEVVEINDVISDLRGGAPFRPSDFVKSGVKVLPKGGVTWGGILRIHDKDQQFCNNDWAEKYVKNIVDKRYTIVVLRDLVPSGPSIGLMVKITSQQKYVLAQGVYGFLAQDFETSEFLIQYSNTIAYRKAANEIMVGSTQVHITNGAFKSLKIPFPPKKERAAIATMLSDMDEEIQALNKRLSKTRHIKQGMMQELLTGKTRLIQGEAHD